jgi:hypothetical protein
MIVDHMVRPLVAVLLRPIESMHQRGLVPPRFNISGFMVCGPSAAMHAVVKLTQGSDFLRTYMLGCQDRFPYHESHADWIGCLTSRSESELSPTGDNNNHGKGVLVHCST